MHRAHYLFRLVPRCLACLFGPTTYHKFQMSAFKSVHVDIQTYSHVKGYILSDCSVSKEETGSEDYSS